MNIVKNSFQIIFGGYTLDITQEEIEERLYYRGECEALEFDIKNRQYLDTVVDLFREKIAEKELQPEIIEYRGFDLTTTREQTGNAWFVGKSTLREDWLVASASKKYVEKCFRQDVDEKLEQEKVIATVQEAQKEVLSYQLNLEAFLERRGYVVSIADSGVCSYGRYAIHPDYYQQWKDETDDNFPDWAVIKIW